MKSVYLRVLALSICSGVALLGFAAAKPKVHVVGLGAAKRVPYSQKGDPAGAGPDEKDLRVRPLIVDGKVKEWTTGEVHDVTDRSFAVRRALRLNDALPSEKTEHWVWQRGPWLLIDRTIGHVAAIRLPEFDPAVSEVAWFRDYAAYCGLSSSGKQLSAVVAQIAARKPILVKKLGAWNAGDHPSPACAAAGWQRDPLQVTFRPTAATEVSYDLVGLSAVLVEEGDEDN
jgi:hypothetical protein